MSVFRTSFGLLSIGVTLMSFSFAGCGDDSEATSTTTGSSTAAGGPHEAECTMPTAVPCEDQVILAMDLQKDPVDAPVTSEADGSGFRSHIDATAGGAFATKQTSFTYARFGADGLEKVDISDEDSLSSMDWDIAFRRYVIRVNSGHSGPSCVQAARVPEKIDQKTVTYDDIDSEPADLGYHKDLYFNDDCSIIPDGSGLDNSPATILSSYWQYPGCVKMSGFNYVLKLADGRRIKFTVEDYYSPDVQEQCNTQGTIPMTNTGSANFQVRWAEIP